MVKPAGSKKAYLLYKRGGGGKLIRAAEKSSPDVDRKDSSAEKNVVTSKEDIQTSESIFTWKSLDYTVSFSHLLRKCPASAEWLMRPPHIQVRAGGKNLKLLDNVQGWCKPGQLTALSSPPSGLVPQRGH